MIKNQSQKVPSNRSFILYEKYNIMDTYFRVTCLVLVTLGFLT
jgi:hypothetical protein